MTDKLAGIDLSRYDVEEVPDRATLVQRITAGRLRRRNLCFVIPGPEFLADHPAPGRLFGADWPWLILWEAS